MLFLTISCSIDYSHGTRFDREHNTDWKRFATTKNILKLEHNEPEREVAAMWNLLSVFDVRSRYCSFVMWIRMVRFTILFLLLCYILPRTRLALYML